MLLLFVLELFTAAYTAMEKRNWTDCPDTTNPVEHITKDSSSRSKDHKESLWCVVDNIYRCDKRAAAKRVAVTNTLTRANNALSEPARRLTQERLEE